jgi:hypothetical protein
MKTKLIYFILGLVVAMTVQSTLSSWLNGVPTINNIPINNKDQYTEARIYMHGLNEEINALNKANEIIKVIPFVHKNTLSKQVSVILELQSLLLDMQMAVNNVKDKYE